MSNNNNVDSEMHEVDLDGESGSFGYAGGATFQPSAQSQMINTGSGKKSSNKFATFSFEVLFLVDKLEF